MKLPTATKQIQTKILYWFKKNGRNLPWRKTRDPYKIWVSEIMLQQTQVSTVIPYYLKFLKTFPTVRSLAKADLSKVLKIWEGLGYYSRARNLHRAAKIILDHFHGRIPETLKDLISLPGIGRYTAGALLSIAFNQELPTVDGNVKRILSRFFAISGVPQKTEKLLREYSTSLIPDGYARSFNQALMDLGSMICTPKDPSCSECPIKNFCQGYRLGKPERFPSQTVKKRIPPVESVAAVIQKDEKVLLRQRPPEGLLGGLWEFPNWRIKKKERLRLRLRGTIKKDLGMKAEVGELLGVFNQTFSHFKLTLNVFGCEAIDGKGEGRGKWVRIKDLDHYPMPRIFRRVAHAIIPSST